MGYPCSPRLRGELLELREEYEEKLSDRAMVRAQLKCQNKKEVNALEKTVAHNSAVLQKNQQIRPTLLKQWDDLCERCESMMENSARELSDISVQQVIDRLRTNYGEVFDEDVAMAAKEKVIDLIKLYIDHQHNSAKDSLENRLPSRNEKQTR